MFPAKRMKVQLEVETRDLDIVLVDDQGKMLGRPKIAMVIDPVSRRVVDTWIIPPTS
jgi:hypothetical protein